MLYWILCEYIILYYKVVSSDKDQKTRLYKLSRKQRAIEALRPKGSPYQSSVQFSSFTQSCPTHWDPMNRSVPGLPVHHQLMESPKAMSIVSVMLSSHLILCRPLLLLLSIFPRIRVFSNKSALHIRWPKYWTFSFNISPTNEHPGLISFRMDWLDLLAVQDYQESSPTP